MTIRLGRIDEDYPDALQLLEVPADTHARKIWQRLVDRTEMRSTVSVGELKQEPQNPFVDLAADHSNCHRYLIWNPFSARRIGGCGHEAIMTQPVASPTPGRTYTHLGRPITDPICYKTHLMR